jgi:hypothetical protein
LRLKHESDPQKNQQEPSLFAETDPFDDEPEEPVDD